MILQGNSTASLETEVVLNQETLDNRWEQIQIGTIVFIRFKIFTGRELSHSGEVTAKSRDSITLKSRDGKRPQILRNSITSIGIVKEEHHSITIESPVQIGK